MKNLPSLRYWIREREQVRIKKGMELAKPWSTDPVFQTTYFCNVMRENDKVTKFIREMYSPFASHPLFVHNIILSRFLNWPPTLDAIGYQETWGPECVKAVLHDLSASGKVWGNAYVVTTHGIKMDKIDYLCDRVMPSIEDVLPHGVWGDSCADVAKTLQHIEGISTFMAGQVVADLKNTEGHPLQNAMDWWTFALPGPGSRRGMDWLMGEKIKESEWYTCLFHLREELQEQGITLCAQDTQNCLCEFDKYMRVSNGTGRSKRRYDGTAS